MGTNGTIRIARVADRCDVLGPGPRAVVWVQGCPFRCAGCCSPDTLAFAGGTIVGVDDLARRLSALESIEGITFSGGEPFAQADQLARLIDEVRAVCPDLSTMSYSGYRREELEAQGGPARSLLDRLDILVDGQYVEALHGDLRWRGSSNQRLHFLTDRYAHLAAEPDRSAGIELWVDADTTLGWFGVPAVPRFRPALERGLETRGISIQRRRRRPQ